MLKKFLLLILGIIPFIFIFSNQIPIPSGYKNVEVSSSFEKFDYVKLKSSSEVIALVEVLDDLTKDNSIINYAKKSPTIEGFYGRREVRVLKYYKDEGNLGDTLSIIEPAAITKKDEYLHCEGYEQMVKGNKYIVFLSDKTASRELSVLSGNNGKINVSDFDNNEFYEILIKTLIEFETKIPKVEKDLILSATPIETAKTSRRARSVDKNEKIINTDLGDLKIEYKSDINGKIIISINGKVFECNN